MPNFYFSISFSGEISPIEKRLFGQPKQIQHFFGFWWKKCAKSFLKSP
jgi:hypothetical protein